MFARITMLLMIALSAVGCTAPPTLPAGHAECLVCKKNADLACIDVAVDKGTPRTEYAGKTYYFCSGECRAAFMKDPQRYVDPK